MVKKVFFKCLRFLLIVLLACLVYVIGFVVYTGTKEAVKAFGPAVSNLWEFATSNPVLVIVSLVCLLAASIIYDKAYKAYKKYKEAKKQNKK